MRTPIQPEDYELLSAYLDGELPESARAALESRLDAEPALHDALDDLRRTVQIVRSAPSIKLPRNFTLDPARYRRRAPWWARYNTMRLVGALGALASIILIALGVFSMSLSGSPAPAASNAAGVAFAITATVTSGVQDKTFSAEAASSIPSQTQSAFTATAIQIAASPSVTTTIQRTALPTVTLPPTSAAAASATQQLASALPAPALAVTNGPAAKGGAGAVAPLAPMPTQPLPLTQPAAANAPASGAAAPTTAQNAQGAATINEQTADSAQQSTQQQPQQPPQPLAPLPTNIPLTPTPALDTRTSAASKIGKDGEAATLAATQGQAATQVPTVIAPPVRDQQGAGFGRSTNAASQLLLISGIALLIFSSMLYAIGWMRSRL